MRTAALLLVVACAPVRSAWQSPLRRDHPLVGKIWEGARFVEEPEALARAGAAHFLLLGETHDNPDHHALQARFVRAHQDTPAIVFEMLDVSQQAAVDGAPRTADGIAHAVDWARSGWPEFAMYRPVFTAALEKGLPVVAGNLTRKQMSVIVREQQLPPQIDALLGREGAPSRDEESAVREEMREEHCGQLPESMVAPMALAQRARDAQLALRMAGSQAGAILIAGSGHVRSDRAVPAHLAALAPGLSVVSVAFLEVAAGKDMPQSYAAAFAGGKLPFDYVVFTPGAQREDPCKGFEKKLKRSRDREPTVVAR